MMKKLLRPLTAALLAALLLTAGCAGAAVLPAGGTDPLFEAWTGIEAVRAVVLCQSLTGRDRPNGEAVHTFLNGDTFLTWETDGEWINAYYSDGADPCWVRGAYTALDPAWYVAGKTTPAYAFPGGETRVALLDAGEKLPILREEGGYFLVGLRGAAAWIKSENDGFAAGQLKNIIYAELRCCGESYSIEQSNLPRLGEMLSSVEDRGEKVSGCPFGQIALIVTLEDGYTLTLDLAADSCCVYRIDGHDYAYARSLFTAEGAPDSRALFELFGFPGLM